MNIIIIIIISAEVSQQGDPLSGLQFCESIQPTLTERERHKQHWGLLTTSTWKGRSHASLDMSKPLSIRDHKPVFYSTSTSVK